MSRLPISINVCKFFPKSNSEDDVLLSANDGVSSAGFVFRAQLYSSHEGESSDFHEWTVPLNNKLRQTFREGHSMQSIGLGIDHPIDKVRRFAVATDFGLVHQTYPGIYEQKWCLERDSNPCQQF